MQIQAFGGLSLKGHAFRRPKPLLVATYVTLQGATSRRRLADLFWPAAMDARDSLGTTIRRLNALRPVPMLTPGDPVRSRIDCDVTAFLEAVDAADFERATDLYAGPFLAGLDLELPEEIEEWVYATRERLAALVRLAHLELASAASARDDLRSTVLHAERALDVAEAPPWLEGQLVRLLGLLQVGASPRLREAEVLAGELGVAYSMAPQGGAPFDPLVGVPRSGTSFVGRQAELAAIGASLEARGARLVTLHGPAGAGKSRLAAEWSLWAAERGSYPDGTYFVRLETLGAAELVAAAVAMAMQLVVPAGGSPEYHLVQVVGSRRMLIVLDNFEHVATAKSLIATIIRSCPNVSVLVTSRITLALSEEHVLEIGGLPVDGPAGQSEALTLLVDRMRQHDSVKRMTAEDELAAQVVCQLVEGSPLALELAAAQTRLVPLRDVVTPLERGIGALVSKDQSAPRRQQSVHAALDVSWELLDDHDRRLAARVAVFRGGFSRDDAATVTGVDTSTLERLVGASLVRLTTDGRLGTHPLVTHYLSEKFHEDAPDVERVERRHALHYLGALASRGHEILGGASALRLSEWLEAELANLQAAWTWALAHDELDALDAVALPLAHFAELRGRYSEVVWLLEAAVDRIDEASAGPIRSPHLNLRGALPFPYFRLGRFEDAVAMGERALAALEGTDVRAGDWSRWAARQGMALSSLVMGRIERARELASANVTDRAPVAPGTPVADLARRVHDVTAGTSLMTLGSIDVALGDYESALVHLQRAEELFTPHRAAFMGYVYWTVGQAHLGRGAIPAAKRALEAGLEYAHETGFRNQVGHLLSELMVVHLAQDQPKRAEGVGRQALELALTSGDRWLEATVLSRFGLVMLRQGRAAVAREWLARSLDTATASGAYGLAMEAVIGCTELAARAGKTFEAARLLAFVVSCPLTSAADAATAGARLAELEGLLAPAEFVAATEAGASLAPADGFRIAGEDGLGVLVRPGTFRERA